MGRPRQGAAYNCYKDAKRNFCRVCRKAVKKGFTRNFSLMDQLYHEKSSSRMWKLVKKHRNSITDSHSAMDMHKLESYFKCKFDTPNGNYMEAESKVSNMYENNSFHASETLSQYSVVKYIKQLRSGCTPGLDLISAEHLKYALKTKLPMFLSKLFTVCLRFAIVPQTFCEGLLIPLLKKQNLDPRIVKNYRPITVSSVCSKVLEYHILDQCADYKNSPSQFGFVSQRSTVMAASLAHDVSRYCVSAGSPLFMCSLDTQGAFDNLPHPVLFDKMSTAIPTPIWCLLYYWYSNMNIRIRWNKVLGNTIPVRITRQGGLSSPFLFNIFYKDLVEEIESSQCGVTINNITYNIYCYADDILISSTTASGLQSLIDKANVNLSSCGLNFNPQKSECIIVGGNPFTTSPKWHLNGEKLPVRDSIVYLGTVIGDRNGEKHTESRLRKATKSFYSLQGCGLNAHGVSPNTGLHIYNTAVRSTMTYVCSAVHISGKYLKKLDQLQGKIIKSILGIPYSSRTTPLLNALELETLTDTVHKASLDLLKSCLLSDSRTQSFYCHLTGIVNTRYKPLVKNTLVDRAMSVCHNKNINYFRYLWDSSYRVKIKHCFINHIHTGAIGFIDSIRNVLNNYNHQNRKTLTCLLKSF